MDTSCNIMSASELVVLLLLLVNSPLLVGSFSVLAHRQSGTTDQGVVYHQPHRVTSLPVQSGTAARRRTQAIFSTSVEDATLSTRADASDDLPWFLTEAATLKRPTEEFFLATAVPGPSIDSKPDYESICGPLGPFADRLFQAVFRAKLAEHAGFDSTFQGYEGIIDIAAKMNRRYDRDQVQQRAQQVLVSLFPTWMPPSYAVLFSKPFPELSARMNAWATWVAGTWLMGECHVNDAVLDGDENDGTLRVGKNQGLLVNRCRFLEEAGCASVCVNSCKLPTQAFFRDNMGLALTMEPNYDTFECQFSFGKLPTDETEQAAKTTPCLARCPTAGRLRALHTIPNVPSSVCELMES